MFHPFSRSVIRFRCQRQLGSPDPEVLSSDCQRGFCSLLRFTPPSTPTPPPSPATPTPSFSYRFTERRHHEIRWSRSRRAGPGPGRWRRGPPPLGRRGLGSDPDWERPHAGRDNRADLSLDEVENVEKRKLRWKI